MDNEKLIKQLVDLSDSAERLKREIESRIPGSRCEIYTMRSVTYDIKNDLMSLSCRTIQYRPVQNVNVLIELFFISDGGIPRKLHREFRYKYEPDFYVVDTNYVKMEITEKVKGMIAEALLLKYDNLSRFYRE